MKKIVLAYSGGLDTSVCVKWLKEKGFSVITFTADLGQNLDFKALRKKAHLSGAAKVYVEDLKNVFIKDFVLPALKANAIYQSKYLLATALSRPLIAKKLVEVAKRENVQYIAHGCTGKGNDQVRLEVCVNILGPKLKIVAPLREWSFQSREEEIDYALKNQLPITLTKKSPYSIDKNLWGVSIECGMLEDPALEPIKEVYQITKDPQKAPAKPKYLEIHLSKGVPCKINGKSYSLLKLISHLNKIGAEYAVGRADLIEDRLIGIKTRELYEAPAATILYTAHKELESLVLDKTTLEFKEKVALEYSKIIYNGLWFTPLKGALDRFIEYTQEKVTGKVKLKLYKGSLSIAGRSSPQSLYKKKLATYGPEDKFDRKAAEGFIKIWGLPYKR